MCCIVLDLEWNQPFSMRSMITTPVRLHGEIIQIGAVKLNEQLEIVDTFKVMVKPKYYPYMHRKISRLTQISNADLAYGFPFKQAFAYFTAWCPEDAVFLTWGNEDFKVLHSNISVHKIKGYHLPKAYDVQRAFSRQIVKERRQYSLIQAMDMIQEPACTAHDALHDAMNTVQVLRHLDLPSLLNDDHPDIPYSQENGLQEMNEDPAEYEIVDFDGPELDAAKAAVELVRQGKADIPMKGILQTSSFAKAILNRETGLIPASGRRLVSQCGIFEYEGRFMMITDAAINIAPDVDTQIGIVENALPVANALGVELPKVAVLSAVENVTEKMPSTVSAAEIAKRGIPGCVVSGPLALDGAISMESVKHKGIHDPVAGQADILLVPFIEIGNVLYKSITYIAGKTMASTICGASCPVIITSRADTPDSKYYSILLAVLRCLKA